MKAIAASALLLASGAAAVQQKAAAGVLKSHDDALTQPLQFHQRLLACNAYPTKEGVSILKNNKSAKSHEKLQFNQCRWIDGRIVPQDRISFKFEKEGVQGTFEVEELPSADSTLLLIVQRRDAKDTDLLSFQSYAFPTSSPDQAKVAFINAVAGDNDDMLEMSDADSASATGKKSSSRRVEDIKYNRVYAIEQGKYEVKMLSEEKKRKAALLAKKEEKKPEAAKKKKGDADKKAEAAKKAAEEKAFHDKVKQLNLIKGHDYVVMKTGTLDGSTQLVAFPTNEVMPMSSTQMLAYASFIVAPIIFVIAGFLMWRHFSSGKSKALASNADSANYGATSV